MTPPESADAAPSIETHPELDSTNAEAKRRAAEGGYGPLWIRAVRQTAGRGRRGRAWSSGEGDLAVTGLFRFDVTPAQAAQLSFAAALSAAETVDAALARERVRVKWPNDVLADGRKIAGLLLESGPAEPSGVWLAVGVGINLVSAPDDAERPATSVAGEGGRLDAEDAARKLAAAFARWSAIWRRNGFAPLRDAWLARAYGLGERCEVRLDNETLSGVFADLEPDGSLRLDLPGGGRRLVSAGDVFFPSAAG